MATMYEAMAILVGAALEVSARGGGDQHPLAVARRAVRIFSGVERATLRDHRKRFSSLVALDRFTFVNYAWSLAMGLEDDLQVTADELFEQLLQQAERRLAAEAAVVSFPPPYEDVVGGTHWCKASFTPTLLTSSSGGPAVARQKFLAWRDRWPDDDSGSEPESGANDR